MGPRLAAALFLALALATACDRDNPWYGTTVPPHAADELWINNGSEPEWIDPAKCADSPGGAIISNTFEGLVTPDPRTLKPTPGMAERWENSADRLTWTFHIRKGTGWSDGTPVTAHDFVWSWLRVLDPATLSKYADQFYDIRNGDAFNQRALHVTGTEDPDAVAKAITAALPPPEPDAPPRVERVKKNAGGTGLFVFLSRPTTADREKAIAAVRALGAGVSAKVAGPEVVGLAATDDHTFVVTLELPVPYFLLKINTLYTFYPQPRHLLDRLRAEGISEDLWTRPEHFVSNGPFTLKEHRFRHYMVFEPNPHYWDRKSISLNRVKTLQIESYTTTLQMYKAGEIDWIGENSNLPSELWHILKTKKDARFTDFMTTYWFFFNTSDPALSDKRVRHALNLATNKQQIVDAVTRQGQKPAWSFVQEGLGGYTGIEGMRYDPERARKLLAEAGFPGGKGLPTITLSYNTSETHKAIAEAIQEMWRKELGIDVRIQNEEWKVYLKNLQIGNFQVGRLGWSADYPDPLTFLSVFTSTSGNNHSHWKDKKFDELLDHAGEADDPEERLRRLAKAEEYLVDALPAMPLYFYTRAYLVKPYVKGLWNNPMDRHPWKSMRIDPDALAKGEVEDGDGGFVDLGKRADP